jgi:Ca2+:H+ antiporter
VVLKVSRGTSVVLLLVYVLYLLFSLKSHAFMYQSTPQHLIDEESHPGVLADMLNSSSSSSDSSSSSSSDTDSSSNSNTTTKRIKRALRRKRRKSTSSTKENASLPTFTRSSSVLTSQGAPTVFGPPSADLEPVFSGDEADVDGEGRTQRHRSRTQTVHSRDFESTAQNDQGSEKSRKRHKKSKKSKHSKKDREKAKKDATDKEKEPVIESLSKENSMPVAETLQPQVGFASEVQEIPPDVASRRPFTMRNFSEAVKPAFSSANFPHHEATGRRLAIPVRPASQARAMHAPVIRRTASLPDILHPSSSSHHLTPSISAPAHHDALSLHAPTEVHTDEVVEPETHLSKTSAVILLLCSTGLVALCAEFLVGSIDYLIANSGVSQAFIGLIILPIVGNAAEHVTAVAVAAKNKMDLAINIALGSSIQIALFVTPLMVILGWIIGTDMSLYFSLFETVSLFASAFIVGFMMIDGRSNYLEGALLIAAYIIIAVSAFFYPTCDLSGVSGPVDGTMPSC